MEIFNFFETQNVSRILEIPKEKKKQLFEKNRNKLKYIEHEYLIFSKNSNRYNSEDINFQSVNRRLLEAQILPFKTRFHLSRYDFRFSRYHRVKKRVIFNRLPQTE